MTSWTAWLVAGLIIAGLTYAIYSVFAKKPLGLYISTVVHIALGILSLPSIGLYVLGLVILELIVGIIINDSGIIRKAIHITNIISLLGLLIFNFFAYFGMHFTPPTQSYTAEYIFLASFHLIWGVFYYLQLKLNYLKTFLILIILEILFFVAWGFSWGAFGHSLLETLFE